MQSLYENKRITMRTKDWKTTGNAKVLVIGEDSNLQWSEKGAEYAMFADYYFRPFPEDHGERSRNVESRNLFNHIMELIPEQVKPEDIYVTNLCNDSIEPSPKGKRVFIPEVKAIKGLEHIEWVLEQNQSIRCVIAMSLQTNYWLQKLGFYGGDADFLHAAEPRRTGMESIMPYYQPVAGNAFSLICGNIYEAKRFPVKVVPVLSATNYPLSEQNKERYGQAYGKIQKYFKENTL